MAATPVSVVVPLSAPALGPRAARALLAILLEANPDDARTRREES